MRRTLDDIRRDGLAALRRELGQAGMIRFLQQFETGRGNYPDDRRDWVERTSLADIAGIVKVKRRASRRNARYKN